MDITDGMLLVDKPAGPTSHDVVDEVRNRFKLTKAGHGGTLDPQATGLLVLLIGRATKLSNLLLESDKTYHGHLRLGVTTDSYDAQGAIVEERDPSSITRDMIEAETQRFTGDLQQTPPMVSAAKKNGVPLYKLARKGKVVERNPKMIHVYEFDLLDFDPPRARFALRCTKGTYVRSLCHDIGQNLGCGAILDELRRTQSGDLHIDEAITFEDLMQIDDDALLEHIVPLHKINIRVQRPPE